MTEYLSFLLQRTSLALLRATTCYLYFQMKTFLKMADSSINDLLLLVPYETPQSDMRRQELVECVLTRNSKQYLGKAYTEKQGNKLSVVEEVDKPFGQMVKSLGKSIIRMYLMGACAVLATSNQDALSEDLESDLFLNSALQRFTCKLYYRFGSFLAPLSIELIMSRHYLSERNITGNKNGRANRDDRP